MPLARAARDAKDYTCTRHFEAQALRRGCRLIAGCDEAGRGSLLGPLYAAAVILDPEKTIHGIDDSKKLTAETRSALAAIIRETAVAYQVVAVSAAEVDELNVYEASRQAMRRALAALNPAPDFVLTDAMPLARPGDRDTFAIPYRAIIHGDAQSVSIAAASILAKVARDEHLEELDRLYPRYQLARNKGYGTPDHLEALAQFGPCPEHRRTFQPVKDYLLPLFPLTPAR
jgi:ribonuclease HII